MVRKGHTHVTTWGVVHDQVQSGSTLEREVESNNELVRCQGEHIPLSASISNQVLRQDLVLFKDFHRVMLGRRFSFLADKEDGTKTALA